MSLLPFLHKAVSGQHLLREEAVAAMEVLLSGEASPVQTAALLTALRMKGETAAELAGFAGAMRAHAIPVCPSRATAVLVDTCGTGGDGAHTFNISTAAGFVVAGAGVPVAKHGNRSVSSRCGSADVLEAMGIPLIEDPRRAADALDQVGIAFLFAPAFHPAMKHVMPARRELKMRTVFNLIGPLANPAPVTHQVIGAPGLAEAAAMAEALHLLGLQGGFVVHGSDGLDEITTTGPTHLFAITPKGVERQPFHPRDWGIALARAEDLAGGDAAENAAIVEGILEGKAGPKRDIVLVNAAFALWSCGQAADFPAALALAVRAVDSGAALASCNALRRFAAAV